MRTTLRNPMMAAMAMAAAMAGMGGAAETAAMEMKRMELAMYPPDTGFHYRDRRRRTKQSARSQRQLRKDRRRAHAAGCRNAFA